MRENPIKQKLAAGGRAFGAMIFALRPRPTLSFDQFSNTGSMPWSSSPISP